MVRSMDVVGGRWSVVWMWSEVGGQKQGCGWK